MVTKIMREWKVTVTLTRTLTWPVEDGENKETFEEWLRSPEGRVHIKDEFRKGMWMTGGHRNTDVEIDDVELTETEVKSTDTDPRV